MPTVRRNTVVVLCSIGVLVATAACSTSGTREPAAPPETAAPPLVAVERLVGSWWGCDAGAWGVFQYEIEIRQTGNRLIGEGLIHSQLTQKERALAALGALETLPENYSGYHFVAEQRFDVHVRGETVLLEGRDLEIIGNKLHEKQRSQYPIELLALSGRYHEDGFIIGSVTGRKGGGDAVFYLRRIDDPNRRFSSRVVKGEVVRLECTDFPQYHYNCRVPAGYDPSSPTPVLVFDNPAGNASPLAAKTAEELGYISVGLVESSNENPDSEFCFFAVMLDLNRRFNVKQDGAILAGFSGGGSRSSMRALYYSDRCRGVIAIGNPSMRAAEAGIPVFYIMGEKDAFYSEYFRERYEKLEDARMNISLATHPGGHMWGLPSLIDQAVRWIDAQR